jgi:hypothetical protein
MTQIFPSGTVTLNFNSLGLLPLKIYGSSVSLPLIVSLPSLAQQMTLSPATPMTRFTRNCLAKAINDENKKGKPYSLPFYLFKI